MAMARRLERAVRTPVGGNMSAPELCGNEVGSCKNGVAHRVPPSIEPERAPRAEGAALANRARQDVALPEVSVIARQSLLTGMHQCRARTIGHQPKCLTASWGERTRRSPRSDLAAGISRSST